MPRSSVYCLEIQMMSHPCNNYEQITLSYHLIVNSLVEDHTLKASAKSARQFKLGLRVNENTYSRSTAWNDSSAYPKLERKNIK